MEKYTMISLRIDTTGESVKTYVTERYERWLDYSRFKCLKAGMEGQEVDVLDEVLLSLLQRDEQFLLKLYNKKKIQKGKEYKELDFYILQAINLNVSSPTSPYRYKNRSIPRANVELSRLKIIEEEYFESDSPAKILKQMRLVRWVYDGLQLTDLERRVFKYVFFQSEQVAQWPGPERSKEIYNIYNQVLHTICHVLYFYGLTNLAPKKEATNRQNELAEAFIRSRKVQKSKTITHI